MILASLLLLAQSGSAGPAQVQILAIPLPLETVRERLDTRSTPVGLWNIMVTGNPGVAISRESAVIAIADWCSIHRAPVPLFLTKEQAWPIIARKAGGRWQTIQRIAGLAGVGVAMVSFPPAAAAGPVLELVSARAAARVPDLSALTAELPATITIPASGGVTLPVWSAKMRQSPIVIGPMELVR